MKLSFYIIILLFAFNSVLAQHQEQTPAALRSHSIKKIELVVFVDSLRSRLIKSEIYNRFGFNTQDIIYTLSGDPGRFYNYTYTSDSIYSGRMTYTDKGMNLCSKTLVDYDYKGNIIAYHEVNPNNKLLIESKMTYDDDNKLTTTYRKMARYAPTLFKENNLWLEKLRPITRDSVKKKDNTYFVYKKYQNEEFNSQECKYKYNDDGTIKSINYTKPNKAIVHFEYDNQKNNTKQTLKSKDKKTTIYLALYNENNCPTSITNTLEMESNVITLIGSIRLLKGDVLVTNIYYTNDGLVDYKTQYLNGQYLARQNYVYEKY